MSTHPGGHILADALVAKPLTAACERLNLEPTRLEEGKTTLSASICGYEGSDGRM